MTVSWTEERTARLKELWDSGMSASQCAAELGGVTRNAVISKIHRKGFQSRASGADLRAPIKRGPRKSAPPPAPFPLARSKFGRCTGATGAADAVLQLGVGMCHWPEGDPLDPDFYFCGEATQHTYCPQHRAIAYVKHGRVSR